MFFFFLLLSFFNVAAAPRPKVGGVEKKVLKSRALACRSVFFFWFFFYAPSLKGCKKMCFFLLQLAPLCKKVHSVPYLTAKHGRVEADGELLHGKECRTLVVLLQNEFISDVVRLVWLLNRLNEDVEFSNYSRLPASVRPFDRLCWQLAFGTFLTARDGMEKRPPWDVNLHPPD